MQIDDMEKAANKHKEELESMDELKIEMEALKELNDTLKENSEKAWVDKLVAANNSHIVDITTPHKPATSVLPSVSNNSGRL